MPQEDITQETERNNMPEDIIQVFQALSTALNRAKEGTMSQQDIVQLLGVIQKLFGVEAAKGFLYWAVFKTGDVLTPAEIEQLQKALQQEDQRALQEILAQALQKVFQQIVQQASQK